MLLCKNTLSCPVCVCVCVCVRACLPACLPTCMWVCVCLHCMPVCVPAYVRVCVMGGAWSVGMCVCVGSLSSPISYNQGAL